MKRLFIFGMGAVLLAFTLILIQEGCSSKSSPVASNNNGGSAPTNTPVNTSTRTSTPTATGTLGTPTSTMTPTTTATVTNTATVTVTVTPTTTQLILFDDTLHVINNESEFDGGAGNSTSSNLVDTTHPHSGTVDALWTFTSLGVGGAAYEGWNVTSPTTDLSGFTACSFWARTDRVYAGNGIEFFGGGGADNGGPVNHVMLVTTSYAQFSFTLPQPLDQVTIPFGIVINATDVSDLGTAGALNVYVDDIQYQ